jgi:ABC-2 type transport system ATP-binding protein
MNDYIIDIQGLSKIFNGKTVVDDVSLSIKKGEVLGFLGPNGSGKTTTMRLLCGLLKPDTGFGTCLGIDILKIDQRVRKKIGYMTQKFSLYEDLSIRENLLFIARAYGLDNIKQRVFNVLDELGLVERQHQRTGYLSGGWKQRLALACSIMHEPELLLLDEPTAGVDPKARREFWDHIHQLSVKGLTVLVSTHYMDEAERCHRIAYIAYGKLITVGETTEVIRESQLATWSLKAPKLMELLPFIRKIPGIEQVTYFGNSLHITGKKSKELTLAIGELRRKDLNFQLKETETSLEDVFIYYMKG